MTLLLLLAAVDAELLGSEVVVELEQAFRLTTVLKHKTKFIKYSFLLTNNLLFKVELVLIVGFRDN